MLKEASTYDVVREQRRHNIRSAVTLMLLVGVLALMAFGNRGAIEWLLLASLVLSLRSILAGRRALSHLRIALTHRDRAG